MGRRQKTTLLDLWYCVIYLVKLFFIGVSIIFLSVIIGGLLGSENYGIIGITIICVIILWKSISKKVRHHNKILYNYYDNDMGMDIDDDIGLYGEYSDINNKMDFLFRNLFCGYVVFFFYIIIRPERIKTIPSLLSFLSGSLLYLVFWKIRDKTKAKRLRQEIKDQNELTERQQRLLAGIREEVMEKIIEKYGASSFECDKCGEPLIFQEESPHMSSARFVCAYCGKEKFIKAIKNIDLSEIINEMKGFCTVLGKESEIAIPTKNFPVNCYRNNYKREHIPEHIRHEVWRRDQGMCVECGNNENLEFDHIIPISKGGSNTARNLRILCEGCNRKKSNKI